MSDIKQFMKTQLEGEVDEATSSSPLIVTTRHDLDSLLEMTKINLLNYAKRHGISINSRKRKHEVIDILMRS
jgi:hypothetical protein